MVACGSEFSTVTEPHSPDHVLLEAQAFGGPSSHEIVPNLDPYEEVLQATKPFHNCQNFVAEALGATTGRSRQAAHLYNDQQPAQQQVVQPIAHPAGSSPTDT